MRNLMLRRVIEDRKALLGYILAMAKQSNGEHSPHEDQFQGLPRGLSTCGNAKTETVAEDPALS